MSLSSKQTTDLIGKKFGRLTVISKTDMGDKKLALGLFNDWFDAVCARNSAENKYHLPVLR